MWRSEFYFQGQVQQVGFRMAIKEQASEQGIVGEVKNLADGRVYLLVEAEKEKIEILLHFIKKNFRIDNYQRTDRPIQTAQYHDLAITF